MEQVYYLHIFKCYNETINMKLNILILTLHIINIERQKLKCLSTLHLIIVHFEVIRLQVHIPVRALWISCTFPRFAAVFSSAKAKCCNSLEEVLCLSPQCCVKVDKEERVDQTVQAGKVECAGVRIVAPLDAQVDDDRPPAEEEGQREEGEDKGHVVGLCPLLLALPHLAQHQPIADKDDQCGNEENCYTRPDEPGVTFHREGAGGEVGGAPIVPIRQEWDGVDEATHPTGEDGFVCSLRRKVTLKQRLVDSRQVPREGDNGEGVDGCGDAQPGAGSEDPTKICIQVMVAVC